MTDPNKQWPHHDPDEVQAVMETLNSGKVNYWNGQIGREFEQAFADQMGTSYGIALSNGTVALELALHVLGVKTGDEVIVTPRSFIASASAIVRLGGIPVFADVDRDSQNITATSIEAALTEKTRAIVCVHLNGWPCEMEDIMDLAAEHDLVVLEDCAQAHGARYHGLYVGTLGHAAAFSFCTDKIMSTGGEGGMLLLDDEMLFKQAWAFKDHGKGYDKVHHYEHPPGYRWLHEGFGTNFRITEMQSVIGLKQLGKLEGWLKQRRANMQTMIDHLASVNGLRVPIPGDSIHHAGYRWDCFVKPEALKEDWSRDRIMDALEDRGLRVRVGSCGEMYRENAFVRHGLAPSVPLPVAHELAETGLSFQVHHRLDQTDMEHLAGQVIEVMKEAVR